MKKLRQKLILLLALFVVVVGVGSWLILINFFPDLAFKDYPLIPLFFLIIGVVSIYILTNLKKERPNKLLNAFMLIRGIKMVFAIILTTVYSLVNRAEIKSFAIMLVVFYLFYLFFETYTYIRLEKWNKKNLTSKNKKEEQ